MSAPVGADIESLCSKCGDVWHVVVAKVGEKIAKVQCKQCGGLHRHKPPGGAPAGASGSPASTAATPRAPAAKRAPASRARRAAEPPAPSVAPDLTRPVRRYAASEMFAVGERVQHPTFGLGVVQALPGPGTIDVAFPDGRRVLAQARAAGSGLGKPTNTFDD
jgi:hypothetical protein